MGGASIGAGKSYPPTFLHRGSQGPGYINSLQLFNNTTCLQSCNVVLPALRHSTAIITLAVAYDYIETRQLCGDCGYIKLPCQQDMFTYFLPRYDSTALH